MSKYTKINFDIFYKTDIIKYNISNKFIMNSPYLEICEIYGKPESWDLAASYEKFDKYPKNCDVAESFFTHSICIICFYLLENECKKYIQNIDLSESLEIHRDLVEDILEANDIKNENKWLNIFIWKSLNHEVHSVKVQTYDFVFSILGSQKPIDGVIYLQDYIEQEK